MSLTYFKQLLVFIAFFLGSQPSEIGDLESFQMETSCRFKINDGLISVASWNIQDLGQSKSTEEINFMANILKDFDIVAIQEVVAKHPAGAQKVAQLADELNRKGAKWDYRISDPTKSPSSHMSERYAFIWKTSKVSIQGRPFLDAELETKIYREPYIAKFKIKETNEDFFLVNFHSRKHDDKPELEIQYFKDYRERFNTNNMVIAGDFNLNERHAVWDSMYQQGFKSALEDSKTTLKRKCAINNYLSHAIDNIYYSSNISFVNSGVIDYIEVCESLEAARKISDHLPVFLEFGIENIKK
ncbi:endonuclease/exonuclease/phosphatase family protein [Bizionia arctica]|uniref:LuxR family transcriptional regulator n=1 Tax=Bizionia arctica TaxID=1495645 RepID=A0A917GN41_9FLAO|nr:endonuclease/exonuclease/phosphatase family protein [Bizionia arctica]GGG52251.1 LuxR family transcriptional regulator [Bizionia arctica]